MRLIYLCAAEVDGIKVSWLARTTKPSELIGVASAAGFTAREIEQSPLGVLEEAYRFSSSEGAVEGAFVLAVDNGAMLIELKD